MARYFKLTEGKPSKSTVANTYDRRRDYSTLTSLNEFVGCCYYYRIAVITWIIDSVSSVNRNLNQSNAVGKYSVAYLRNALWDACAFKTWTALKVLNLAVLCHFCHHNATHNSLNTNKCCKSGIVAKKTKFYRGGHLSFIHFVICLVSSINSWQACGVSVWYRKSVAIRWIVTGRHPRFSDASPSFGWVNLVYPYFRITFLPLMMYRPLVGWATRRPFRS